MNILGNLNGKALKENEDERRLIVVNLNKLYSLLYLMITKAVHSSPFYFRLTD